jgi:hypothetical protein
VIATIAALIREVLALVGDLRGLIADWKKVRLEQWAIDGRELAKRLKEARTDDERRDLLHRIADHSRGPGGL